MFIQAKLKLSRANAHTARFNELVKEFSESQWFELKADNDHIKGTATLVLRMIVEPPADELALILGDALHNFRSALDVAFFDLVKSLNRTPTEHTMFPVRKKREDLEKLLLKGSLAEDLDAHACILDKIRPYTGGDELLLALHALDIQDKHCLLIPTVNVGGISGLYADIVRGIGTIAVRDTGVAGVVSMDQPLGLIKAEGARIVLKQYGEPLLYLTFAETTPLRGEAIGPALALIAERVRHAIECFEELLLARTPGTAEYVAAHPIAAGTHRRTSLCPCGSGLKYKKCHEPFLAATAPLG